MKKTRIPLGTATLVAVALITGAPTSASASASAVPFRATFSGSAVFTSDGTPAFTGTGQATHMGAITTYGTVKFTNASGPTCAGGVPNTNTETLTAANGDTLTISSDDVACPTGPYQYHGSGNWTVLPGAGTGRFANAAGQGSFDGHSDFAAGTFDITLVGTITAPGN